MVLLLLECSEEIDVLEFGRKGSSTGTREAGVVYLYPDLYGR